MRTNTSDLVRQINYISEEHEQIIKELKNMQSVIEYINLIMEAYGYMSDNVKDIRAELDVLKESLPPSKANKRAVRPRIEQTKFPDMGIIMGKRK